MDQGTGIDRTVGGLERITVVADHSWLQKLGDGVGFLASASARSFDTDHHDEAPAWITSK
ncbi:STAS/SEC14 domain-containing protein [Arthrobacter rhombi]|uniref:STAS/SEC14 domain-containing protein n=1 Tax=Arthrobacter rhombi TaxID=71253 RepID=UPI003FD3A12E